MNKINIALLSGGDSPEREVSLNSGKQVFAALDKEKYNVTGYDPAFDLNKLIADASNIDFALIIMHGNLGEDGSVQGLLDLLKIPYQGAGILGSALAMNKMVSKQLYEYEIYEVLRILGVDVPIRARIESISGYSAHRDRDGLFDFAAGGVDTLEHVYAVMGEPKASLFLVQRIRDNLGVDASAPESDQVVNLEM